MLTVKRWTETTDSIGSRSKAGRYGGTYAHMDIAFEFASWVSVEFRLYLIKEFQRLSDEEKEYKSKRKLVQEKLIKFATRIPAFMYLTDFRENTLRM